MSSTALPKVYFLAAKAKRAAKNFANSKERLALDERIAACEAAALLAVRLGSMHQPVLLQQLTILEPFAADFPLQLALKVTERNYQHELSSVLLGHRKVDGKEIPQLLKDLLSTFRYWDLDIAKHAGKSCIRPNQPTFKPAVADLVQRWCQEEYGRGEDEDDAFQNLVVKQRALEKKNSSDSAGDEPSDKQQEAKRLTADVEAGQPACIWNVAINNLALKGVESS